jgi:hypothetical protein
MEPLSSQEELLKVFKIAICTLVSTAVVEQGSFDLLASGQIGLRDISHL